MNYEAKCKRRRAHGPTPCLCCPGECVGAPPTKLPALFAFKGAPKFVTDGCSGYMTYLCEWLTGKPPPWNGGCVVHDRYYWTGGSPLHLGGKRVTRAQADAFLFDYIKGRGYVKWAWLCWIGVRLGGSQLLPFSWRWRYRERYLDVVRSL